jgi:HAD superfamily hydrolase (TIGR01450 family)
MKVKAAGSDSLRLALQAAGHKVLPDGSPELADYVVIGRDLEFTYEKLQWIALEAWRGARVIAANPDLYHPGLHGERIPETGALAAAIEAAAGIKVESVGKPGPFMFNLGMKRAGSTPELSMMVGDNPATDILGAKRAGMYAAWIAGHVQPEAAGQQERQPDVTVAGMQELYLLYKLAREQA